MALTALKPWKCPNCLRLFNLPDDVTGVVMFTEQDGEIKAEINSEIYCPLCEADIYSANVMVTYEKK